MNKLIAIALVASLNWVLGVVVALEEGPIALTAILVGMAMVTQIAVLGMIIAEARPVQVPGDG